MLGDPMKVGSICYATSRGLGHLAKDFYDNGIVTDVLIIEHASIPTNRDWYPNATYIPIRNIGKNNDKTLYDFCKSMGAMLFFETPFDWNLFTFCRQEGIKTYLMTMHECTPKSIFRSPPYCYLCPSLLDVDYFEERGSESVFLPIPVKNNNWKCRTIAKKFIHNGGYLGLRGREGTTLLIDSLPHIKSPIELEIRVQENVSSEYQSLMAKDSRVNYINKTLPYEELFSTGDCYIAPQKFNGCSLPLQEAFSAGLPIITTNRYPMNTWLPTELMFNPSGYKLAQIGPAYLQFEESIIDPLVLARTIDYWYGKDLSEFSVLGKDWGDKHSWEVLGPIYKEVIHEGVIHSKS